LSRTLPKPHRGRATVADAIDQYNALQQNSRRASEDRGVRYAAMIEQYYDLVTEFYEFGWGQSFHFAPRHPGESRRASILRLEHYIALRLDLRADMSVIDVGCGVGGPMRNIARFAGVHVTGVTINGHQVERGRRRIAEAGLSDRCRIVQGDFMALPFGDRVFDAAFALESVCHAPDRRDVFSEVLRTLRPGALFAGVDWCMTDRYDPDDPVHRELKRGIEEAHAIPGLTVIEELTSALTDAGFELLEARDLIADSQVPWFQPLTGREGGVEGFRISPLGRALTHGATAVLEALRVAPTGTRDVHRLLLGAADALVASGELGIFTPDFFFLARKPHA
jgi:sterol 24-C-methyltransferase